MSSMLWPLTDTSASPGASSSSSAMLPGSIRLMTCYLFFFMACSLLFLCGLSFISHTLPNEVRCPKSYVFLEYPKGIFFCMILRNRRNSGLSFPAISSMLILHITDLVCKFHFILRFPGFYVILRQITNNLNSIFP